MIGLCSLSACLHCCFIYLVNAGLFCSC
jgi:hypothetical protein